MGATESTQPKTVPNDWKSEDDMRQMKAEDDMRQMKADLKELAELFLRAENKVFTENTDYVIRLFLPLEPGKNPKW